MTNQTRIEGEVLSWPGITIHARAFGTECWLGKREIGYPHNALKLVDIPCSRKEPGDVDDGIRLLERTSQLAGEQARRLARRATRNAANDPHINV